MEVIKITLLTLIVVAFLSTIVTAAVRAYLKKMEEQLELESKAELMEAYKKAYLDYKKAYERLRQTQSDRTVIKVPEGTVDAVRYAMVHNHPDNGGDPEKFRIYRECYEKLKGNG